jgi:hypothetical protein
MSQTDREVELDQPGLAVTTARDARADLAQTAREAATDVARTTRDAATEVARTTRDAAADVARTTRDAAAEVARTAKEETRQVAHTAADEAQEVGRGVRQRLREEVDRQHRQVTDRVGAFAEELYTMARERPDTPAGELVGILATRSRSFAEYLDRHGPERVLHELQDFARRRPGTFIVSAVAAGFVIGRLGKGLWQNPPEDRRS